MAHFRKQIRDTIQARLTAVLNGVPVYSSRITPFRDTELPAVNVLPVSSERLDERQNGDRLLHNVNVAIAVHVSGRQTETCDGTDEISSLIEPAMRPSADWRLPVREFGYLSDDVGIEPGADGALVTLTYRYSTEVVYSAGDPGAPPIAAQHRS